MSVNIFSRLVVEIVWAVFCLLGELVFVNVVRLFLLVESDDD